MNSRHLVLISLFSLTGCGSPQVTGPAELPEWARAQDELAPLGETLPPPREAGVAAGVAPGSGEPLDLSRRISSGPSPRNSRASAPSRRASSSPGSSAQPKLPSPAALETTGSRLERLYAGRVPREVQRRLDQFGYGVFQRSLRASDPGPVPDDYQIGPGDELVISISGSFTHHLRRTVDREGRIQLPEVGPLDAAGLSRSRLEERLAQTYGRTRRNFELSLSLGRLRQVRVVLTGRVAKPGPVDVPARASLLDVLSAAGGVLKEGSLRRIELRRGEKVERLDLYEVLLASTEAAWPRIRAGDRVHVPELGATLAVGGLVKRPGIYELLGQKTTLAAALEQAGGLTPFSFTPRLQVEGSDGRRRTLRDVKLGAAEDLSPGEFVLIGAVEGQVPVVRVQGEVVRPGNFAYRPGLRVSDLLDLAEGLTIEAFSQAFLSRRVQSGRPSGERVTRRLLLVDLGKARAKDPAHDVLLEPLDLLRVRPRGTAATLPTVRSEGALRSAGRYECTWGLRASELLALSGGLVPNAASTAELIRRAPREGALDVIRYRLDLERLQAGDDRHDPFLKDGDRLVIRRLARVSTEVEVRGEVRFPGRYTFPAGARISDLIAAAGGARPSADLRAAVFTRQSVRRLQVERFRHLLERNQRQDLRALEGLTRDGHAGEVMAGRLTLRKSRELLRRMERSEATGRVVVPFLQRDFVGSIHDLALESGDRLVVKRRQETVSVVGLVFNPSTFVAERGITVEDVLDRAGGLLEDADEDRIYVVRADGVVESMAQRRNPLELESQLLAGDVVLVPRRPMERGIGQQLADGLSLARQTAELGLIMSKIASPQSGVQLQSNVERSEAFPRRSFQPEPR